MPQCAVCNERDQKYKCPACQAPYCSVACFKLHKVRCGESPSGPSTNTPLLDVPAPTTIPLRTRTAWRGITRSLDDLRIPEEREEEKGLWDDPLRSGEVKPLRRTEYLELAKSQPLRQLLAPPDPSLPAYAHPQTHLRALLTAIASIKNLKEREEILGRCLGVEAQRGVPAGRGHGGKRGGKTQGQARGEGFYIPTPIPHPAPTDPTDATPLTTPLPMKTPSKGLYIGAQEQETMREFAEVVRRVLEREEGADGEGVDGRGVKRKVEWGV